MTKKLLFLMKTAVLSAVFLSCSGGSDDANESQNTVPGKGENNLALVSSKTQASIDTPFEFSFQNEGFLHVNNVNWDFGDGDTYYGNSSMAKIYHNYKTAGNYTVKATVLLANGDNIVKTVSITVTNTNLLKINKITIISIPQKTNNMRWVSIGAGGSWQAFTGSWDESRSYGTNDMNKYADLFMDISKSSAAPDPTNPHNLLPVHMQHLVTTGLTPNQMSMVFDMSSYNLVMGYEALESISIFFKDSDASFSLLEDGGADELISTYSIPAQAFTSTSGTFTQGNLSFKVDFQKL